MLSALRYKPISALKKFCYEQILRRWHLLKNCQKLYIGAACLMLFSTNIAALVALIALIVDFWPRFVQVWNSLAGKTLILLLYAATTNFALPTAAGMVNEVTGLDASYFTYAHYTAILLNLPVWIFGVSCVVLALLQAFFPLFFMIMLGLRVVGVRSTQIFKNIHYPVFTMLLRFALSLLLLVKSVAFWDYLNDVEQEVTILNVNIGEQSSNTEEKVTEAQSENEEEGSYQAAILQLIADFIYRYEANSHSRCALTENARSVDLNAYQHVEIKKDESRPQGYSFDVKACESPGLPGL